MRAFSLSAASLAAPALIASPAGATVKDGVDAWQAGNYAKAIGEWRGPADAGDPDAQFNLAQAYKLGRGVTADMATAQRWYEKAANQGHEQAQANLGLILFQNGDRAGAMPWIRKAADRGEPRAQYVLGTAMFNGDLAPKDWPRAYALMTRAAAAGLPQASTSLAEMDKYIPLGERQRGMAIARSLTQGAGGDGSSVAASSGTRAGSAATRVAQAAPPAARPAPAPAPARAPAPTPPASEAKAPTAKPAPAAVATSAGGRWRVQLGAYSTQAAARTAWSGFSGISGLSGASPSFVQAGAVYRLQAGPFADKAAATRACAAATKAGKSCFPVAP